MKCIQIIIPKRMEGERLDVAISEMLPEHSRSKITSWIKSGEAMINERIFKPKDKVSGDDGFLGITNFGSISIETKDIHLKKSDLSSDVFSPDDLPDALRIFQSNQASQTGSFFRDDILFDHCFHKSANAGAQWRAIRNQDSLVGYLVYRGDCIIELYVDATVKSKALMSLLKNALDLGQKINFDIGFGHSLITELSELHHSRNQRYAWRGGHIAKITNPLSVLEKMSDKFLTRVNQVGVAPFSLKINKILFQYDGTRVSVTEQASGEFADIKFKDTYWVHLIFGVDSPRFYIYSNGEKVGLLSVLFPILWPQFPKLDQF